MYRDIQLTIASVYKQTTNGLILQINKYKKIELQTAENNVANFKLQRHSQRIFGDTQVLLEIKDNENMYWKYDSRRGFYTNTVMTDEKTNMFTCEFTNERGVVNKLRVMLFIAGR